MFQEIPLDIFPPSWNNRVKIQNFMLHAAVPYAAHYITINSMCRGGPLYPVASTLLSLTITAPTFLLVQLEREAVGRKDLIIEKLRERASEYDGFYRKVIYEYLEKLDFSGLMGNRYFRNSEMFQEIPLDRETKARKATGNH